MTPSVPDKMRRRLYAAALLSGLLLFINAITSELGAFLSSGVSEGLSLPISYIRRLNGYVDPSGPRPLMFTFIDNLNEKEETLLYAWKEAWHAAGWDTKVLTLEDAEKHAHFKERDLALRAENMRLGNDEVLSFHRYMAMAYAGGGWMSDWDVYPLNPLKNGGHLTSLPNEGRFTLYERLGDGKGVVPSIISGTAKEYNRIAALLQESAVEYGSKATNWSDLNALCDLRAKNPEAFASEDAVVPGRSVLTGIPDHLVLDTENWGKDCLITSGKLAVHFTPVILKGKYLREGVTKALASSVSLTWLDMWAGRCTDTTKPNDSQQ